MRSNIFWSLTCLLIVLATVLFSGWLPAAPATKATQQKVIVKKVIVKIGHAYRAELKRGGKTKTFSAKFLRAEDANAQYLQWRSSVQFGKSLKTGPCLKK